MLNADEEKQLVRELIGSAEAMGQALSPNAAAMMVTDLSEIPLQVSRMALRHVRTHYRGRLTFAVIREQVIAQDGRPEREEAWGMALIGYDNSASVVWTTETMLALESARPALDAGDKYAARLAFHAAYDRLLQAARDNQVPCCWTLSQGWEPSGRKLALDTAVRLGRIPQETALAIGCDLQPAALTHEGRGLIRALTGPSRDNLLALSCDEKTREALARESEAPAHFTPLDRERLEALRKSVAEGSKRKAEARNQQLIEQRAALQNKKDQVADQVAKALA